MVIYSELLPNILDQYQELAKKYRFDKRFLFGLIKKKSKIIIELINVY